MFYRAMVQAVGGDLVFVRGNLQEAGGCTRGFTKANNGAEGGVTVERGLEACGSREVN